MSTAREVQRLTVVSVTVEALSQYIALQQRVEGSMHATDSERELARYRKAAAQDAIEAIEAL